MKTLILDFARQLDQADDITLFAIQGLFVSVVAMITIYNTMLKRS